MLRIACGVNVRRVAAYRQFARDYRRLAAMLTKPSDRLALELMATGWDKVADCREALLLGGPRNFRTTPINQSAPADQKLSPAQA